MLLILLPAAAAAGTLSTSFKLDYVMYSYTVADELAAGRIGDADTTETSDTTDRQTIGMTLSLGYMFTPKIGVATNLYLEYFATPDFRWYGDEQIISDLSVTSDDSFKFDTTEYMMFEQDLLLMLKLSNNFTIAPGIKLLVNEKDAYTEGTVNDKNETPEDYSYIAGGVLGLGGGVYAGVNKQLFKNVFYLSSYSMSILAADYYLDFNDDNDNTVNSSSATGMVINSTAKESIAVYFPSSQMMLEFGVRLKHFFYLVSGATATGEFERTNFNQVYNGSISIMTGLTKVF